MFPFMMSTSAGSWGILGTIGFWLHVHWFFALTMIVGAVFFLVWGLKNLHGPKLMTLSLWLLAIGIVGALATSPFKIMGVRWFLSEWRGGPTGDTMQKMMDLMSDHDAGKKTSAHMEMMDMMKAVRGE